MAGDNARAWLIWCSWLLAILLRYLQYIATSSDMQVTAADLVDSKDKVLDSVNIGCGVGESFSMSATGKAITTTYSA